MTTKRNRKGFTIVELIIVIAVIGVLAAILIPTFSSIVTKSHRKSAISDAKNALTVCIERFTSEGIKESPDLVFFVQKGGLIFVSAYSAASDGLVEFATEYKRSGASMNGQILQIIGELKLNNYVIDSPDDVTAFDTLVNDLNTDTLRIRANMIVDSTFAGGTTTQTGSTPGAVVTPGAVTPPPGTDSPEATATAEPTAGPTTEPTGAPAGGTLEFSAGTNASNGGGAKSGTIPASQNVPAGVFATIPDDIIPRSVTLTTGNTNAYAFTHWEDTAGNKFYPGDAFCMTGSLELTAQWESGYTVIMDADGIYDLFDDYHLTANMNKKIILGDDVVLSNYNTACMLPLGMGDYDYLPFTGVFDGAGYTLDNLEVEYGGSAIPAALFLQNDGTIRNLNIGVDGLYSTGLRNAAVAGTNNGTIRNVDVEYGNYHSSALQGIVSLSTSSNQKMVGGIAGMNNGLISGCTVDGMTIGSYDGYMGGITGDNGADGIVEKCNVNAVTVTLTVNGSIGQFGEGIGGIVGHNRGTVRQCVSTAFVQSGGQYVYDVGGLVGIHDAGTIQNCYVDWSANTIEDYFNVNTGVSIGNRAGVFVGLCNSGATVSGCIGIGSANTDYVDTPFSTSILYTSTYNATTVQNTYIVGDDPNDIVSEIATVSNRALLTGLDTSVWDLSGLTPIIPCCG